MNIAIASTFHPYRGGIASFNDRLAKSLEAEGHTVKTFNWKRQYPKFFFPGKDQTKSGHTHPPKGAVLDSINPFSWRKVASEITAGEKIDVLYLPFWHSALSPALSSLARKVKKISPETKIVGIIHNSGSHDGSPADKKLSSVFLNSLDECITLSNIVSQRVSELAPELKCTTLFHPLYDHYPQRISKSTAVESLGLRPEIPTVLFFGLIRPYKGLDVLIEAASIVKQDVQFLVAGESYEPWSKYEKLIVDSGIAEKFTVLGKFIPDSELSTIFSASDVLVLPYKNATQSGVTATALHYDLPIIASRIGDLPDSITENLTGLLVPPSDSKSLAMAIDKWFTSNPDPSATHTMVAQAYSSVKSSKSWSSFAAHLTSLT